MTSILYLASIDIPHRKARAIQVVNTCHALAGAGAQVTLVGGRRGSISDAEILAPFGLEPHPGLRLVRVPVARVPSRLDSWFSRVWQASFLCSLAVVLPRILRETQPDVILVRDLRLAWLLCKLAPSIRDRITFEAHDLSSFEAELRGRPSEAARLKAIEQAVFQQVGSLITITGELKRLVMELHGVAEERIAVVPDATRPPHVSPLESDQRSGVYYVGQLYPWKGADTLIEAAALYREPGYVIVGGTEDAEGDSDQHVKRLAQRARSLGLASDVHFTGWVPYHEVADRLRYAAIGVIPLPDTPFGRYFTSPLKLFDYMAAGVPIIASDLPSLREVLHHGSNALLVHPNAPSALAEAIRTLHQDPELARELGNQGFQDVQHFTWEARAARLLWAVQSIPMAAT